MPIIKTLKNGVWTPVNSVTSLGTATFSTAGLMSAEDKTTLDGNKAFGTTIPMEFGQEYTFNTNGYAYVSCGYQAVTNNGNFFVTLDNKSLSSWRPDTNNSSFCSFYIPKGMPVTVSKGSGITASCLVEFHPIINA